MPRIIAGSRLHLGFYNIRASRVFGSIGVYIEEPATIVGKEGSTYKDEPRIARLVCGSQDPMVRARLERHPPQHVGLGSTTQITLSLARFYSIVCDKRFPILTLARITGRGEVSGIGIHGFRMGGFIVDAGKRSLTDKNPPPILFRAPFPRSWRIILLIPYGIKGYGEDEERRLLRNIEVAPRDEDRLKKLLLLQVIPGLIDRNLRVFGKGIEDIQAVMGRVFSPFQRGDYFSDETYKAIEILREAGAVGTGQSSWGPLAYGFARQDEENLIGKIERGIYKENLKADLMITRARNKGARVEV